MDPLELLDALSRVRWSALRATYGNCHSTLIGLLVEWWVSLSPCRHSALEGPPAWGPRNAGWADAMFCASDDAVGVLEVEGANPLKKIQTIEHYFDAPRFGALRFAILVVYPTGPKGPRERRRFPNAATPEVLGALKRLTERRDEHFAVLVALDKTLEHPVVGIRTVSEYYAGAVSAITGILFQRGRERKRLEYLRA